MDLEINLIADSQFIKDVNKRINPRIVAYRAFSVLTSELREAKSFLTKFHVEISHSKLWGIMKTKQNSKLIIIIKESAEKVNTRTDEKQNCAELRVRGVKL